MRKRTLNPSRSPELLSRTVRKNRCRCWNLLQTKAWYQAASLRGATKALHETLFYNVICHLTACADEIEICPTLHSAVKFRHKMPVCRK